MGQVQLRSRAVAACSDSNFQHGITWDCSCCAVRRCAVLCCADLQEQDDKFAIVFAAMGVNMETAHFFKQVCVCAPVACPARCCGSSTVSSPARTNGWSKPPPLQQG